MNELKKLLQGKPKPTGLRLKELARVDVSELKKLPSAQLVHIITKYDATLGTQSKQLEERSKSLATADAELSELKDQLRHLRHANSLLHNEINSALVKSHESEAALRLVTSQLEGFKLQCRDKDALLAAYKAQQVSCLSTSETPRDTNGSTENKDNTLQDLMERLYEQDQAHLQLSVKTLEKENSYLTAKVTELEQSCQEATQQFSTQHELAAKLQFNNASLKQEVHYLQDKLGQKELLLQEKEAEKAHVAAQTAEQAAIIAQLQLRLDQACAEHAGTVQRLETERCSADHAWESAANDLRSQLAAAQEKAATAQQAKAENEALQKQVAGLTKQADRLTKEVLLLKQKQSSAKTEVTRLNRKLRKSSASPRSIKTDQSVDLSAPDFLTQLKRKVDKVYKTLMTDVARALEDEISFYSLTPIQFASIERTLNQLVVLIHEQVELTELQRQQALPVKLDVGLFSQPDKLKCGTPSAESVRKKYSFRKLADLRRILD